VTGASVAPGGTSGGPDAPARGVSPFAVFGIVAGLAGAWAILEMLGYTVEPALAGPTLPTLAGILIALGAFFFFGLKSPPND